MAQKTNLLKYSRSQTASFLGTAVSINGSSIIYVCGRDTYIESASTISYGAHVADPVLAFAIVV
jgi:hypothetical protein